MTAKIPASHVRIKRAYEAASADDGQRILIDRLWPRGIKKEKLQLAEWNKDLAPSTELRKWFAHEPEKWPEFRRRYAQELKQNPEAFKKLQEQAAKEVLTLVFSAHNEEQNNAVAMREYLLNAQGLDADY